MAQQVTLVASSRHQTGTGSARTLRRAGQVPAIIYGHGREPEALSIDATVLGRTLQGVTASTVLDVSVDGRAPVKALIREIQRDALRSSTVLHLDLYEIHADEEVEVRIPVRLVGIPDGVRNFGGVLDFMHRDVQIRVLPADIPDHIDLDVNALTIGHSLFVRDIQLVTGEILEDGDTPICTVVAPRAEEVVVPVVEEAPAEPELIRKPKPEEETEEKS
ncbi:MAG TPA: 50S ribosomal protein L25 [Gemmatimonadales bacterium]|nr:50S ribosomal protein L25 [Gemmatimonadales bacterium]